MYPVCHSSEPASFSFCLLLHSLQFFFFLNNPAFTFKSCAHLWTITNELPLLFLLLDKRRLVKSAGEKFLSLCFIHHFSPSFVSGEAACHFPIIYLESSMTRSLCFSRSLQKTESAINLPLFGKAISVLPSTFSPEYFIEPKQEEREEEQKRMYSQFSTGLTV